MEEVRYGTVPNFSRYCVGTDGSVWSRARPGRRTLSVFWKRLAPTFDKDGYQRVCLIDDADKRQLRGVHTMVLRAFRGPCPPKMEGRHLDGNKDHNYLSNLEWGTKSANELDRVRHGTHHFAKKGANHPATKISDATVAEIIRLVDAGFSRREVAAALGVSTQYVTDTKRHRGRKPPRKKVKPCV